MRNNDAIAYKLKLIRLRQGWTQQFVSKMSGLSIRSISRIENGYPASNKTITKLCNLYKIDIDTVYSPTESTKATKVNLLPEDILTGILYRNSFLSDLQREVILQFSRSIIDNAVMDRSDIEIVLANVIDNKKNYTFSDVIAACMAVNESTIQSIKDVAVA